MFSFWWPSEFTLSRVDVEENRALFLSPTSSFLEFFAFSILGSCPDESAERDDDDDRH